MRIHYIFNDRKRDEEHYHKLIIVKQMSKFRYTLELYKKPVEQIPDISSMKLGCFLYLKNGKYVIYDARNYLMKEFNEPAEFLVEKEYHSNIDNAINELFNKKY